MHLLHTLAAGTHINKNLIDNTMLSSFANQSYLNIYLPEQIYHVRNRYFETQIYLQIWYNIIW